MGSLNVFEAGLARLAGVPRVNAPDGPLPPILAPKERLVAAIAANGCLLTAANVATVLSAAGITQEELRAFTPQLAAEGRAEVSGEGTIRVLTDTCI